MVSARILLTIFGCTLYASWPAQAAYPPSFLNVSGCLYSHLDDTDLGQYQIILPDAESQQGNLKGLSYDSSSNCIDGINPGNLNMLFELGDNNMKSLTIKFLIKSYPSEGYWSIDKATLVIDPANQRQFNSDTFDLIPTDIYAGSKFSYSCSALVLQNSITDKNEPSFRITLRKFQVQPFAESETVVFAPSYDCTVWITLPIIMGAILLFFIIFTVMIGIYLLMEQGNQNSDLRFNKQGGMLMNQAQLDATKG